jgi:ferrochelatase
MFPYIAFSQGDSEMIKQALKFLPLALMSATAMAMPDKVGVLFSSFGDVDSAEELEPFVKKTLSDRDVVPLPRWMRPVVVDLGWKLSQKDVLAEYAAIGGASHFRANSQLQANAVARVLQNRGLNATGYTGFTMTFPDISNSLAKAQAEGVQELVVFYQGAQWSRPTAQIVQRETIKYLKAHPEWNARVTMVRSFSDDPRFHSMMIENIRHRLQSDFAGLAPNDVCIVLPAHGNPVKLNEQGDPAYSQMMRVFDSVRAAFPAHRVFHGFQNHSEIPTLKWTTPDMDDVVKDVGANECQNVLINGRTSFTVDSLETLYDHAIAEVNEILAVNPGKRIIVEKMFNDDESFASYMADLVEEAISGKGDVTKLR